MKRTAYLTCIFLSFVGSSQGYADLPEYQAAVRAEPGAISQYTFDASDLSDDLGPNDGSAQGTVVFSPGVGGGMIGPCHE